jgi:hypothetical protein
MLSAGSRVAIGSCHIADVDALLPSEAEPILMKYGKIAQSLLASLIANASSPLRHFLKCVRQ